MNPKLDRKYPNLIDIEKAALKRLPKFVADYIRYGMGQGGSVCRNLDALAAVKMLPRYALDPGDLQLSTELFGQTWAAPFGIAPVGLGGMAWPAAAETLAASAQKFDIPFTAATFALASPEHLKQAAGECAWFQMYRPNVAKIESDLIERVKKAGYRVLMVTADIPSEMRRAHDIRNGFSNPPRLSWFTLREILMHPAWSLNLAWHSFGHGIPKFETFDSYLPSNLSAVESMQFQTDLALGHISVDVIRRIRDSWPGTLIVKGVLDPRDAVLYQEQGVDGVVVSNHGGRQLEAAPSALEMLPAIRAAVGEGFPLLADGGVRSGLDICRMLASGADFVLMGRPFYYAMAAMGKPGADHIIELLMEELRCTMGQLGCSEVAGLADRLMKSK